MAPTPPDLRGVPGWVGPLLIAAAASVFGWGLGMTSSIGAKIEAQTIQLAEAKKTLEMLCQFAEEKKRLDQIQDDRIRQIELRMQSLSR